MESKDMQAIMDAINNTKSAIDSQYKAMADQTTANTKAIAEIMKIINRPVIAAAEKKGVIDERKAAFYAYVKGGMQALNAEQKALIADTTGHVLIPEVLETQIYQFLTRLNVMRNLVTTTTITRGDKIRRVSLTDVQVSHGVLETDTPTNSLTESTVTPTEAFQYITDANGLTKIGVNELEDSFTNLDAYLAESFARAFADLEDADIIRGRGFTTYGEPEGILNTSVVNVDRVTTEAANAVSFDDLKEVIYACPARYRRNAVWVMNSQTEKAISKLKNSVNGDYYWQADNQKGSPAYLLGYPVYNQDDIPTIAADADVAIFGDLKAYRLIDRKGMTIKRLDEVYATSGLVGFLANRRYGGGLLSKAPVRILHTKAV